MQDLNYDYPKRGADEPELISWLEDEFERGSRLRKPYLRKTLQALLFLAGDQWSSVEYDMTRIFGRKPQLAPGVERARIVDNQHQIFVRQIVSDISEAFSDMESVPATSDPEDVAAAQLATRFLRMRDRVDHEDEIREREIMWALVSGETLRLTYYDPSIESYDLMPGDIKTELVNHLCYIKSQDGDMWPPRWLVHFDARHVDWVKATYGVEIEPERVADQIEALDRLSMNVVSQRSLPEEERRSSVVLKRMYAMPCERYPEGQVFVWAAGKLLKQHDFQPGIGFPFSRIQWYPIPARQYPMSYIEPLISDQRALNTLLSQQHEIRIKQMRGDFITQGTGEVQQRIVDSETGQKMIQLEAGISKWAFMDYSDLARGAEAELARLYRNMHDKGGLPEPSLGQIASKDMTATEMQLLREAGFSKLGFHMRLIERHLCEASRHKLALAKEFYCTPRLVVDTGRYSQRDSDYFFGSELRGTRDIVAIPSPRMTPAMKRKAMADAAKQGLFGPWVDPKSGLPSPFIQFSARTVLRNIGLIDEDERIAQDFGSYDELAAKVGQLQKIGEEAWVALQVQALAPVLGGMGGAPAPAPAPAPPGFPGPEPPMGAIPADIPPLAVDAAGASELPYVPMEGGMMPVAPQLV